MGSSNWMRFLGIFAMVVLLTAGCSDKSQSPKLTGAPPDFLAGVWEVTDSSADCYHSPFPNWSREAVFTDTICLGGPDFGALNARATWEMYLRYNEILPGLWTPLEINSCSGTISDTLIMVYCEGTANYFLFDCEFAVRLHTVAAPNGDHWILRRFIERVEKGRKCGYRRDDSLYECASYMTVLKRIGEVPESCDENGSSTIGP